VIYSTSRGLPCRRLAACGFRRRFICPINLDFRESLAGPGKRCRLCRSALPASDRGIDWAIGAARVDVGAAELMLAKQPYVTGATDVGAISAWGIVAFVSLILTARLVGPITDDLNIVNRNRSAGYRS
jgi:hypothetical protein